MPADKYSFKANDSVRSFAQQMLHLAGGNVYLMMNALINQTFEHQVHHRGQTTTYFCLQGIKPMYRAFDVKVSCVS